METPPLVSVIVPVYNRIHFLPQLFDTIFSQDYEKFEVIIVDDGSTDGSADWIEDNQASFRKPILLLSQENQGHYSARNNGLDHANGEYIAFQDSDDEWPEYHLSSLVSIMSANSDIDWLFGKLRRISHETGETIEESNLVDKDGNIHPFLTLSHEKRPGGVMVFNDPGIGEVAITRRVPGSTQSALIRRRVFSSNRFDPSYRTAYDQFFAVKVVLAGFTFAHIDEIHQIYHVHNENISLVAGADAEKLERAGITHVRGYSSIIPLTQTPRERKAANKQVAYHYAWMLSVAYRQQEQHDKEFEALCGAIRHDPTHLPYWKTALSAAIRRLAKPKR